MGLGVGSFLAASWRPNTHSPDIVEVLPSNYGTTGSLADLRRRRFDTIVAPVSGADPRLPRWNGLLPVVWRLRVLDDAKMAALASRSPRPFGMPVTFTPPKTASLVASSAGLPNAGSLLK